MSSPLAIAGVTSLIHSVIHQVVMDEDLAGLLNEPVGVSAIAPDRVIPENGDETNQINIFMYQVTPNLGWRNEMLASRSSTGERLTNQPLALDLHYIVSAYGTSDFHAEVLLGHVVQTLHEIPVLDRNTIDTLLVAAADPDLSTTRLSTQVEQIKITPEYVNMEDMSRIWSSLQTNYRMTAAYMVTVVLIQREEPLLNVLPVLTRGIDDTGPLVTPSLQLPVPTIESIEYVNRQISVQYHAAFTLRGHHLNGNNVAVRFESDRLDNPINVAPAVASNTLVNVDIPDNPGVWVAGLYRARVVYLNALNDEIISNLCPVLVAPNLAAVPAGNIVRDNATQALTVTVTFAPEVTDEQEISLIIGNAAANPQAFAGRVAQLTFVYPDLPIGVYPIRLRVDGVESHYIDKTINALHPVPTFNQTVNIAV